MSCRSDCPISVSTNIPYILSRVRARLGLTTPASRRSTSGEGFLKKTFFIFALCILLLATVLSIYFGPQSSTSERMRCRELAITFDDLPAPGGSVVSDDAATLKEMTGRLLRSIRANNIPAVGFVNEEKLYKNGEFDPRVAILQMWLDAGLELGNHTFSHMDLQTTPLAAYKEDVIRGENITAKLLHERGMKLRYFRHPYLHVGPNLATRRAFESFLTERGYTIAPVTISNEEYIFAAVYARALARADRETGERVAKAYISYMERLFEYFEKLSMDLLGYEVKQVQIGRAHV